MQNKRIDTITSVRGALELSRFDTNIYIKLKERKFDHELPPPQVYMVKSRSQISLLWRFFVGYTTDVL